VIIDKLCALENAEDGLVFSSEMAAIISVGIEDPEDFMADIEQTLK
jgi:cystathionine beta-lyase/cystathionine gamma-synthase